jgi:hypothetical protein
MYAVYTFLLVLLKFFQTVNHLPGPTIIVGKECRWKDKYFSISPSVDILEQMGALLATYYLLQRNYPSSYGQLLGALQECILGHPFPYKGKKLTNFLEQIL